MLKNELYWAWLPGGISEVADRQQQAKSVALTAAEAKTCMWEDLCETMKEFKLVSGNSKGESNAPITKTDR